VESRERWQALQTHLSAARACFERDDRTQALDQINAALALDPDFLAAHSLRDRIVDAERTPRRTAAPADGWTRFEERARQRRIEHRVRAARLAISRQRFDEAAVALDEVRELAPRHPEIATLAEALEAIYEPESLLRRHGLSIAAAAALFVAVFGAAWVDDTQQILVSYPTPLTSPILPGAEPRAIVTTMIDEMRVAEAIGTTGTVGAEPAADPATFDATLEPSPLAVGSDMPAASNDIPVAVIPAANGEEAVRQVVRPPDK
jgi:tetratricopeptide (TPR) repeat protein